MNSNTQRIGNFTSSEIVALTKMGSREMTEEELKDYKKKFPQSKKRMIEDGFGEAALTYILETNMERRLGRSVSEDSKAKSLVWGNVLEQFSFDKLGMEYTLSSTETDVHPSIPYWSGSKDGTKTDTVIDLKNPMTLKSFCALVDPLYDGISGMDAMNAIRFGYTDPRGFAHPKHRDGEKYYWQLVSNSCIIGARFAELIVHMPYREEIPEIKNMVDGNPDAYWISYADENELPFLIRGKEYKDINIIRFEVPQEDKYFLTQRVIEAGKMLIPSVITAHYDNNVNATIVE